MSDYVKESIRQGIRSDIQENAMQDDAKSSCESLDMVKHIDKALASMGDNLMEMRLECLKLAEHSIESPRTTDAILYRARRYANFVIGTNE